ncbi:glyoxalase [Arthrobacter psychrolactophilus]|uniref:Glyoxalase n=1 Tax=Arthrobacter psychrolactophilus TaxID=92442 RepID=A0A2V5IPF6_9MICC|nr:VOC family protein [Arthrobacter psychrolactophilus]PYI38478.1 glyoxalase [Arthrobacter psychrolactophilus]
MDENVAGALHHIELWVPSIERATVEWGWMLTTLGYSLDQNWGKGASWRRGSSYLVTEESPAMSAHQHERTAPGLNHLAFHAGSRERVDALVVAAMAHGWKQLFAEKYPHAGGDDHYAAYLVNSDGFEVELVAEAGSESS